MEPPRPTEPSDVRNGWIPGDIERRLGNRCTGLAFERRFQSARSAAVLGEPARELVAIAMRHPNLARTGRVDCAIQLIPIGVVREHEAAAEIASSPRAANRHPARREGSAVRFEAT